MNQFEEFKKKFNEEFSGGNEDSKIYSFISHFEDGNNPLNAELKQDNDEESYDSYGSEDTTLERVFYFPDFNIFVMFKGTRQSYNGTEWNEMKEVKPSEKSKIIYE